MCSACCVCTQKLVCASFAEVEQKGGHIGGFQYTDKVPPLCIVCADIFHTGQPRLNMESGSAERGTVTPCDRGRG
jgi:hypothetical protein